MKAMQEATTQGNKERRKFLELAFGGLPYTEMLRTITDPVMYTKELENNPKEMKSI
jgi:hypothetical protein